MGAAGKHAVKIADVADLARRERDGIPLSPISRFLFLVRQGSLSKERFESPASVSRNIDRARPWREKELELSLPHASPLAHARSYEGEHVNSHANCGIPSACLLRLDVISEGSHVRDECVGANLVCPAEFHDPPAVAVQRGDRVTDAGLQ
jgi:hypothetical protein